MASREHSSEHSPAEDSSNLEKGQADADGGKDQQEGPPQPVHFFHPALNRVRKQVLLLWVRTTVILSVFILCVLSLYWAVQYRVYHNYNALGVFFVDFDGMPPYDTGGTPLIGPMVTKTLNAQNMLAEPPNVLDFKSPPPHPGWEVRPPSMFNDDPIQVRQAVYDFKAWAAIIINANATALLRQAVATGNVSYDPLGAAQIIYVQARDETTIDSYIFPALSRFQIQFASMFVVANDPTVLSNIQAAPQAVNPAIGFSTFNLRPFSPPTAVPAVTVGLIYLIILSSFSYPFYLPVHLKFIKPEGHPPLIYWQEIIWRWCATIAAYFFLSFYSMLSLAFQIPFNNSPASHTEVANNANAFGKGTFPVYWMLNWVGMTALGLACENVAMVVGQPWTGLWLIFWVITNVSTSFYEIALEPHFYYWGYAWPLHNIVEASRQIIFDLHSRLGLNFGILFTWCAINTILFVPSCYFLKWQMQKQKKKEAEGKED